MGQGLGSKVYISVMHDPALHPRHPRLEARADQDLMLRAPLSRTHERSKLCYCQPERRDDYAKQIIH